MYNNIYFNSKNTFYMAPDTTTPTTMDLVIPGVDNCSGTDVQITNFVFEGFNFDLTQDPVVADILFSTADSSLIVTGFVTDAQLPLTNMTIENNGITFA